jgi:hypothetical protein
MSPETLATLDNDQKLRAEVLELIVKHRDAFDNNYHTLDFADDWFNYIKNGVEA